MNRIAFLPLFFWLAASPSLITADDACPQPPGDPETAFRQPPDAVRPWAYWWWLKGNVSRESITRDLEAMKRVGFGGLLQFDARGYHEDHVPPPASRMEFMSPQWREMLKFSIAEARRLGLQVSVNLSSCAGALKGPWDVGADSPKRLIWTSTELTGGQRAELTLDRPAEKHYHDIAILAVRLDPQVAGTLRVPSAPNDKSPRPSALEVNDLTANLDAQGHLAWDVPPGSWRLIRFGYAAMDGHDYDVDILDRQAVTGHFDRMGRAILADAGDAAPGTLSHFYSVSWEGAAPTWTPTLEREFQARRGYPLRMWLPVLAGCTVHTSEESSRLLRDYHTTLSELFMDNFYGTLRELCHQSGIRWHSESGGPWERRLPTFAHADQLAFLSRNDMPQGEFWVPFRGLNRPIAMTAHIYGRPLAAAEAFTHMIRHWSCYPALLKPCADAAFCDGVNHLVWHTFTSSPPEFGLPGSEYFAGTHINPNVTWFDQARPLIDYLARCQFLLRQGRFVGDVCVYTGEHAYLHWGRGFSWGDKATVTLGKGYAYDLVNTEVLLERLAVKDGRLVLPDGMSYRVMVVDLGDDTASPQAVSKIRELVQGGATVVLGTRRPQRAAGLSGYPSCDAEVRRLAVELWGEVDRPASRTLGQGRLIAATTADDVLQSLGVLPDFQGPFDYTHRQSTDLDVYFLSGEGRAECIFRVQGKEPELWDPQTGESRPAMAWHATPDGRTMIPIELSKSGSVFVVFRRPVAAAHLVSITGPEGGWQFDRTTDAGLQLRLWRPGTYTFERSDQRQTELRGPTDAALTLAGPWTVRFQSGRGAPESAVFDELQPWDKHSDPGIKHFSGKATYTKTFTLTADQATGPLRLSLGEVKYVAQVRLNGRDLGVVWTDPWTVDLAGAAGAGENRLEIDVVNTWVNRLIGDAGLSAEKRITKTNVALHPGKQPIKPYQGFCSEDPLMPSGLLGPVQVEFGRRQTLAW